MLKNLDVWISIFIWAACGFLYWLIMDFPPPILKNTPAPAYFPKLLVACLTLLGLWLFIKKFMEHRAGKLEAFAWDTQVIKSVLVTIVYVTLVPFIGFFPATLVFFAFFSRLFGRVKWSSLLMSAVLFTAFIYGFFYTLLDVPLPDGQLYDMIVR